MKLTEAEREYLGMIVNAVISNMRETHPVWIELTPDAREECSRIGERLYLEGFAKAAAHLKTEAEEMSIDWQARMKL